MSAEPSTVEGMIHHETVTVGTSRATLTATGRKLARGVTLKADAANTDTVFVGGPSVTDAAGANPGYPLAAGESLFIAVAHPEQVNLIGGAASQKIAAVGL